MLVYIADEYVFENSSQNKYHKTALTWTSKDITKYINDQSKKFQKPKSNPWSNHKCCYTIFFFHLFQTLQKHCSIILNL